MIKQIAKVKLRFILGTTLVFLLSLIAQINLIIPLFLTSLLFYLKFKGAKSNYTLLNISLLFLISFVSGYYIIKQGLKPEWAWLVFCIPFSFIPMLTTLLFNDLEISFLITLATSFSIASVSNNSFQLGMLSSISGILSSILVKDARKRTTVIQAGFIVGIMQLTTLIFIDRFWMAQPFRYLILLLNGLISSIIVLGVLPVFEYLFKTVTNISLLELADFNHPLLQRLIQEAPGTYHHSLVAGNLSESACRLVGANALLARIGAYYHDIGKTQKPEYFSENQNINENKHNTLSPAMSKLVIMNHIKEGVELANKYKLNPVLINFIQQHHGTSLVYYFYRRALEGLEEDQDIKEEGFRYPGPKPNTKETAIVLLADSVEAATRALKDPMPAKIEEVVHKIINNKFIDGQLDECDLTLKDLEEISSVFIKILSGIYHSRVTYPEEPRSANNYKKFSKEDSRLSQKDKKDNS